MRVSQQVLAEAGVRRATLLMGTPANKAMLAEAGLMCSDLDAARPADLMIVVEADTAAAIDGARTAIARSARRGAGTGRRRRVPAASPARSIALALAQAGTARARADFGARPLRGGGSDEGAEAGHARVHLQRQRSARRGARAEEALAAQGPAGDGAGLRHGDHSRRAARLRQRRPPRRDRSRRRIGHRAAGGHVPHPCNGTGHLARDRHRQSRCP